MGAATTAGDFTSAGFGCGVSLGKVGSAVGSVSAGVGSGVSRGEVWSAVGFGSAVGLAAPLLAQAIATAVVRLKRSNKARRALDLISVPLPRLISVFPLSCITSGSTFLFQSEAKLPVYASADGTLPLWYNKSRVGYPVMHLQN